MINALTSRQNIVEIASETPELSTLVTALKAGDLVETLSGEGPYTVFAPTNTAFNQLPNGTLTHLLRPESKPELQKILTYHVVSGRYCSPELRSVRHLKTVEGQEVTVCNRLGRLLINNECVIKPDISASNGVIHLIGGVLLPK